LVSDRAEAVSGPVLLSAGAGAFAQRAGARSSLLIPVVLVLCDLLAIVTANLVAIGVYQGPAAPFASGDALPLTFRDVAMVLFVPLGWASGLYGSVGRAPWEGTRSSISTIALVWAGVMGTITIILFLLKTGATFSRGEVILFAVLGLPLLVMFRAAANRLIRRGFASGVIANRNALLLVIGEDRWSEQIRKDGAAIGLRLREVWAAKRVTGASAVKLSHDMVARARATGVSELLIAAPAGDIERVRLVAEPLRLAPLRVRLVMDPDLAWIAGPAATQIGNSIVVELSREPLHWGERWAKRCFDLVFALAALVLLAPLLLLVAAVIRLETPGPVLFRQSRDGFGDRSFLIYKFRSMRVLEDGPEIVQAKRGDARITRVGRFIRRTSIDELPQLLNVLRGDMSIVGPRPHAIAHGELYSKMIGEYAHRHHVKPGLTGWAQVNGSRGETPTVDSMKRRVSLDLWYIANWSFWLDVRIILMTIGHVLTGRNAY
jgi:Undecaprenyl-phosphate glucose phosphotransferase